MYLNAYGQLRNMTGWQRTKDRFRGIMLGLKEGTIDHFSDHLMHNYIRHIEKIAQDET